MFKGGSICKLSDGTIINVGKTVRDSEGNTTNIVDWSKVPGVKYTPNKPSQNSTTQNNRLRVGEIADSNVKLDKKIIQSSGKVVISGDCKFYHHSSNK